MPHNGDTAHRDQARFHIVCSDQSRNGKTLVARLLCDFLILSRRAPLIFDAAPSPGGLRSWFPARASKADLSTTAGQMALFDRALARPLHDCVVDLPAHLLPAAADLMRHIGFGEERHTPGLELVVLYVADRNADSLLAGRKLRGTLRPARFIVVKNEAIMRDAEPDRVAKFLYDGLAREGQLVVPELDGAVTAAIENKTFSFRRFAEEEAPANLPPEVCAGIEDALSRVFRQFDVLGLGSDRKPRAAAGA
jgi:hypothetical protein